MTSCFRHSERIDLWQNYLGTLEKLHRNTMDSTAASKSDHESDST